MQNAECKMQNSECKIQNAKLVFRFSFVFNPAYAGFSSLRLGIVQTSLPSALAPLRRFVSRLSSLVSRLSSKLFISTRKVDFSIVE